VRHLSKLDYKQANWIRRLANIIPFYRHLGITLMRANWGTAEIQLKVTRKLVQSTGAAHGGVTASLIDSAIGLALCTMVDPRVLVTTVGLNVNYIAPAGLGVLKARGRILHKGNRIAVGDAEVRDEHGRLVSNGSATYMILEKTRKRILSPS